MHPVLRLLAWHGMPATEALDQVSSYLGVSFQVSRISSNEALELALDAEPYDLICPSDYLVAKLSRRGRLKPLDLQSVANQSHLEPWFLEMAYDPGCRYSLPLAYGTTGFLATQRMARTDGWESLFRPPADARFGMLGEVREVVGAALIACGYSLNDCSERALDEAATLLMEQQPHVTGYSSDDFLSPILGGSVQLQHAWSSPGYVAVVTEPGLQYVVPKEGATLWVTTGAIPIDCPHENLAHAALDALLAPDVAAVTATLSGYATPNRSARQLLDAAVRDNPVLYPSADILARCETAKDLGDGDVRMQAVFESLLRSFENA